ncbi:hypothetical protein V1279_002857 [Bradyrhizobium sp. AZCC 1610]|uniref:hypothetical protein n=1 Tax=Bradyrhizobium sp. AZCC 1610 TaxID=3117020 RepID=UPI002FEF0ED5
MSRRTVILTLALVFGAIGAYVAWPRHADLRGFEPAEIARLETAMWRDYYDKRYPALFYHLYEMSRTQFDFSPLDSFRIALAAAQAAKVFQPTRSREAADAALPPLVTTIACSHPPRPAASTSRRRRALNSIGGRRGAKPWAQNNTA